MEDGHFAALKESELLEERLQQLGSVEPYIGTFFSKEYVLKKVLRMNDSDIQQMRDQIKKETETDPMDGGIILPPGGDGINRIPIGPADEPIDPKCLPQIGLNYRGGVDPDDPEHDGKPDDPKQVEDESDQEVQTMKKERKNE